MKFLKFVKIRLPSNCKVFQFAQHWLQLRTVISLQSIAMRQLMNGNSEQLRTPILTLERP